MSGLTLLLPTSGARSFVFDACALFAAAAAVYGILRNRPRRRGVWQLFALGLALFAAGDVVFDVAQRAFGRADGYPFADVLYLAAYPVLAIALVRLARARLDRETLLDSAIVAVAVSAVIWQWVVTPVIESTNGASPLERAATVAYPLMDILLVVVIVHAVFTLPRWSAAAWLLFAGLGLMLVGDALYARLVADGTYADGGALDAVWPIAYFLLAAAVMHPSMRALWEGADAGLIRHGRARMFVLGAALFAAPAIVLLDDSGSSASVVLAAITGIAALGVAWRIIRLVDESNQARVVLGESEARFRALVQHATDIITVVTPSGRVKYMSPAVDGIFQGNTDSVVGSSFVDYLDPAGIEQSIALFETLLEHPERPVTTEFRVFDGAEWRWIEATWTNQLDEPAVRGIVGNLREITDRKRAAAFTQAETRVLELILSGAPVSETLTLLIDALEEYVPDGAGSIRLLDAAAAPSSRSPHRASIPGTSRRSASSRPSKTSMRSSARPSSTSSATWRRRVHGPTSPSSASPTVSEASGRCRSAVPTATRSWDCSAISSTPCVTRSPASWRCSNGSATSSRSRSTATRTRSSSGTSPSTTPSRACRTARSRRTASDTRWSGLHTATTRRWWRCCSSTSTASSSSTTASATTRATSSSSR